MKQVLGGRTGVCLGFLSLRQQLDIQVDTISRHTHWSHKSGVWWKRKSVPGLEMKTWELLAYVCWVRSPREWAWLRKMAEPWAFLHQGASGQRRNQPSTQRRSDPQVGENIVEYLEASRKEGVKKGRELSPVSILLMLGLVRSKSPGTLRRVLGAKACSGLREISRR